MLPCAADTSTISVWELSALLGPGSPAKTSRNGCPILIDCRERDEHTICRLQGALLIPPASIAEDFETQIPDRSRSIIIYCHHGMRSRRAAALLRRKGYSLTFSLEGGINAWATEVDPAMARY